MVVIRPELKKTSLLWTLNSILSQWGNFSAPKYKWSSKNNGSTVKPVH